MNRRSFLIAAAVSGAGFTKVNGVPNVLKDINAVSSLQPDPLEGEVFHLGPGFKSIEWVNLDELKISWKANHDMDGFGIAHAYGDPYEDSIMLGKAPRFDGERVVPLIDLITRENTGYPTRKFKLHAFSGSFGQINFVTEHLGGVSFTIPKSIAPSSFTD